MVDTWRSEAEGVMYPQASTGSLFRTDLQVGFQSLKEELFTFSSSSKVKKLAISCIFFDHLSCGIIFPRFLRSLSLFDTVLSFFGRKTIEQCPFEFFGHYLGVLCSFSGLKDIF